mmetsp:Transcript_289/g.638  ORF Transcript_289/g.638 Transcript_289/m.638 type:complete len:447 (-) Transcript_289:321-1661(-)
MRGQWIATLKLLLAASLVLVSMQQTPRKKWDPPEEVFDLALLKMGWSEWSLYEPGPKLGKGRYSEVTECTEKSSGAKRACKVFKTYDQFKILKEAKILQLLQGGPNIIGWYDAVRGIYSQVVEDWDKEDRSWGIENLPNTARYGMIFEYVASASYKTQFAEFEDNDVRYYMHEVLAALAYVHSKGIMHRDVKPHNVVYNHTERKMRLIDFGLSEWYSPDRRYSLSVGSRYYKAPELLVGSHKYDYSVDVWATGCMLGSIVYQFTPLFEGEDDKSQLSEIVEVLGTKAFLNWTSTSGVEWNRSAVPSELLEGETDFKRRDWGEFVDEDNSHLAHEVALDLLDKLLRFDTKDRLTAKQALKHPYFDPIRHMIPSRPEIGDPMERYVQVGYRERHAAQEQQNTAMQNNVKQDPRTLEALKKKWARMEAEKKAEEEKQAKAEEEKQKSEL